jgi:hypothetical protein
MHDAATRAVAHEGNPLNQRKKCPHGGALFCVEQISEQNRSSVGVGRVRGHFQAPLCRPEASLLGGSNLSLKGDFS